MSEDRIRIKRVYKDPSTDDGKRILIDRLWPRGLSKERVQADLWLKEIAPSTELRKWFHHDPHKWSEFKKKYFMELDKNKEAVSTLEKISEDHPVTLLYAAKDTKQNHAIALKEYLQEGKYL